MLCAYYRKIGQGLGTRERGTGAPDKPLKHRDVAVYCYVHVVQDIVIVGDRAVCAALLAVAAGTHEKSLEVLHVSDNLVACAMEVLQGKQREVEYELPCRHQSRDFSSDIL